MNKPTEAQQAIIDSKANKIAISASAGSGKTTTMIQRIVKIIELGNSRLDQLLVLTFTDASAKDMRKKLKEKLNHVSPVEVQSASIGTFHSFCANIVRAWFNVAGVNPNFVVMDEIESNRIKSAVFDQVVLENYDKVSLAVDLFAVSRNLDELRSVVFEIHNFLASRRNQSEWLRNTALKTYDLDVDHNQSVQVLIDYYHQVANRYRMYLINFNHNSSQMDFVINVTEQILNAKTYTEFQNLKFDFPRLVKEKDFVQYDDFKNLRSDLKKLCENLMEQFKFSVASVQTDIEHDREIVWQLFDLVQLFEQTYNAKKSEYKKLDYNDLEKYALIVLRNQEAMTSIRNQFKYIFVDEGQDTNPVQFEIIDLLRGDDKFFYIVGDIKQSIYGFRDCEPELFNRLFHDKQVAQFPLNQNFRSIPEILHFINGVMQPLIDDYHDKHQFVINKQVDLATLNQVVRIETADDLTSQMELVYQYIKEKSSHYAFNDIAVLSETTTHYEELQQYLGTRGIPCVIDRQSEALEKAEIILLNRFLFAAMNPTNDLARYTVLQYLFHFTNDELARLRLGKLDKDLNKKIADSDAILTYYRQLGRTQSTYDVLTQVATQFGMLEMPVVNAYLTAIRGVSDFDTVARYLYLVEHKLVNIQINVGGNVSNAVKLMTIHHSKGLEFPVVILFNMGTRWGLTKRKNGKIALDKDLGICLASVDTENYVQKSPVLRLGIVKYQKVRDIEESKRLLYVALTRPKQELYIIGSWNRKEYIIEPDSMLDLINPIGVVDRGKLEPSPVQNTTQKTETLNELIQCQCDYDANILVKQSVTALAKTAEPFQDYVAPCKFNDEGGKEFGTAYHRQIQYGDLPTAVQTLVDGYATYRELPFLYLQDQTIVQGIIDLLAVKDNEAIIVDYKTTRLPREQLIIKYREQLRLYAQAVPGYHVRTYLYSTVHDELIEVIF